MTPLHPRGCSRGDGSLGPPNRKEQELREVCRQIAELAPQKFGNVREAFRYLRPDHNGKVTRSEVCYFFRAYGVQRVQADRLFAYFNPSELDDIDCQQFIEYFRTHILPENDEGTGSDEQPGDESTRSLDGSGIALRAPGGEAFCAKMVKEFRAMFEEVRAKAPQKFSHVREALRIVDVDYDGSITRNEMQHFFRAFGIDEMASDKLFNKMEKGGPGGANYHTFVQIVGPFLELPGVVAATQPPSRPQSARSRPGSARSRPQSADRASLPVLDSPRAPAAVVRNDVTDVLESALSTCGSPCFPALPCGGEKAARSPSLGRNAPFRKTPYPVMSPRHKSNSPRQSNATSCDSPRLPAPVRNNGKRPESVSSARGRSPSPAPAPKAERVLSARGRSPSPAPKACAIGPTPPAPLASRPGRRPAGIQRAAPIAEKVKDATNAKLRQSEHIEALISGGRPIASPFRRSGSQGMPQCQTP